MYRTIVVPIDGSARALSAIPTARRLARLHQARLRLVTVVAPGVPPGQTDAILAAGRHAAGDATIDADVLEGVDVAATLARLDRNEPDSLLCLTTTARRPLGRALFGSVAREVVRQSGEAIVLVGPACDVAPVDEVQRLLVCLDGSPEGEMILPWATWWSETTALPLVLLRVVYPLVEVEARVPPTDTELDALGYVQAIALRLQQAGHHVTGVTVQHPSPSEAIVELASDSGGTLVAVSTAQGAPEGDPLERGTAARVVRHSAVPVLVARRPLPAPHV